MRLTAPVFPLTAIMAIPLFSQNSGPSTPLQFEVAVVKPAVDLTAPGLITHLPGERGYRGVNMPLLDYLRVAYQVRADQLAGPDWIANEHFDLEAKADRTCTADELHSMLQQLLEDRFHIKLHHETKVVSGYNLLVDAGSPKLTEHDPSDHAMMPIPHGGGRHMASNIAMQYFAFYLSDELGETVVDKTGLTGHNDFQVSWGADGPMAMMFVPGNSSEHESAQTPASGVTVFEALRKQLGLRLEKAKVPREHIVIDHIEKLADH